MRLSLEYLLTRRRAATSQEMERLVGHLTFVVLGRRESLSCFRAVYNFIRAGYVDAHSLWPSVVRELTIFKGLLVLLHRRLDLPTDEVVRAFDACETGHASVAGQWPLDLFELRMCWHEQTTQQVA